MPRVQFTFATFLRAIAGAYTGFCFGFLLGMGSNVVACFGAVVVALIAATIGGRSIHGATLAVATGAILGVLVLVCAGATAYPDAMMSRPAHEGETVLHSRAYRREIHQQHGVLFGIPIGAVLGAGAGFASWKLATRKQPHEREVAELNDSR
jgi:site-specific recombinase